MHTNTSTTYSNFFVHHSKAGLKFLYLWVGVIFIYHVDPVSMLQERVRHSLRVIPWQW